MTTKQIGYLLATIGVILSILMLFYYLTYRPKSSTIFYISDTFYGDVFKELLDQESIEYFPWKKSDFSDQVNSDQIRYVVYRKDNDKIKQLSELALEFTRNSTGDPVHSACALNQTKLLLNELEIYYFVDDEDIYESKYIVWTNSIDREKHNIGGQIFGINHSCDNK